MKLLCSLSFGHLYTKFEITKFINRQLVVAEIAGTVTFHRLTALHNYIFLENLNQP